MLKSLHTLVSLEASQHETLTGYGFKSSEKGLSQGCKATSIRAGWVWCPPGPGRHWKRTQRKFTDARSCGVGSGFDRKTLKPSGFRWREIQANVRRPAVENTSGDSARACPCVYRRWHMQKERMTECFLAKITSALSASVSSWDCWGAAARKCPP